MTWTRELESAPSDGRDRAPRPRVPQTPAAQASVPEAILALQRTAGNAAVTAALKRAPGKAPPGRSSATPIPGRRSNPTTRSSRRPAPTSSSAG